ncbi:MAG: alanine--tRNA ligase, partial [Candidatus Marinimicrobia bacterium]|nr:alanine--tRNA ligase [Candidatus Neomarinimicrobiota bacterium]
VVIRKDVATLDELKSIGDYIQKKLSSGIVVIFSKGEEKPMAVVSISKDLNEKGLFAGPIAKAIGSYMGGGGGGKPHMATAGGKNNESINSSIELTKKLIFESLNRKINAV